MNYGIDFKGGLLLEVQAEKPVDMRELREKLSRFGTDLQPVGNDGTEVVIKALGGGESEQEQMKTVREIRAELGDSFMVRRTEMVGPRVGAELIHNSILAVTIASVAIALYIWLRFEWQFAFGVLLSLVHDVLITVGLFSLFDLPFDMTVVAGIMMLAGYSTNDTIVCYDRIRENLYKFRKMPIPEMINKTTNDMLPRTILTSVTTFLALGTMLFIGGEALQGFAIVMVWGTVVGTYSTIYVAMPLLMYLNVRKTLESKSAAVSPYENA